MKRSLLSMFDEMAIHAQYITLARFPDERGEGQILIYRFGHLKSFCACFTVMEREGRCLLITADLTSTLTNRAHDLLFQNCRSSSSRPCFLTITRISAIVMHIVAISAQYVTQFSLSLQSLQRQTMSESPRKFEVLFSRIPMMKTQGANIINAAYSTGDLSDVIQQGSFESMLVATVLSTCALLYCTHSFRMAGAICFGFTCRALCLVINVSVLLPLRKSRKRLFHSTCLADFHIHRQLPLGMFHIITQTSPKIISFYRTRRRCKHLEEIGLPTHERPYEAKLEGGRG